MLAAVFLFGWLLERRHGPWAPMLVFLVGGAGGMALAVARRRRGPRAGRQRRARWRCSAPGSVRDLLGRRRGEEDDSDMLGVLAIAVVLVLLPLAATRRARWPASAAAVIGLLLGLPLARMRER